MVLNAASIAIKVDPLMALCDELEAKLTHSKTDGAKLMEAVTNCHRLIFTMNNANSQINLRLPFKLQSATEQYVENYGYRNISLK